MMPHSIILESVQRASHPQAGWRTGLAQQQTAWLYGAVIDACQVVICLASVVAEGNQTGGCSTFWAFLLRQRTRENILL